MGAYPFILRLFALISALIVFYVYSIPWHGKRLYEANKGHDEHSTEYGTVGWGLYRTYVRTLS